MSERWYLVAVSDGTTVTVAAAEAAHPGAAIAAAVARVGRKDRVWPIAAAAAADGAIPLGESIGRGVVVLADPPAVTSTFEPPAGVVPILGERARAAIAAGYTRGRGDDGGYVLHAVVPGVAARETFLDVVERLPAVNNVEIEVAAHLDPAGERQVWLTPPLRDVRRAIRFLDDFRDDCLTSGHVDVAVYVRSPRSTWRLTQHKTLVWLSDDAALTDRVASWLQVPVCEVLATIADGPHLHYRGPQSSLRGRLLTRLKRAGLRRVDR